MGADQPNRSNGEEELVKKNWSKRTGQKNWSKSQREGDELVKTSERRGRSKAVRWSKGQTEPVQTELVKRNWSNGTGQTELVKRNRSNSLTLATARPRGRPKRLHSQSRVLFCGQWSLINGPWSMSKKRVFFYAFFKNSLFSMVNSQCVF